ncbi:MAG: calcium-binding protein [Candidatus Electrothrix communis]|nr:MAG: calcium-binding protein [Candidatus Electrothrix communis]
MTRVQKDEERENRIDLEVVVDACDKVERAMGWFYYLAEQCEFPFQARCIVERSISPLLVDEEVEVLSEAPAEECEKELFVKIQWKEHQLAVPLSQLSVIEASSTSRQIVEDWQYWVQQGYEY